MMEITLAFAADSPPLSVITAAKIGGILVTTDSSLPSGSTPFFQFACGLKLHGATVLLRYLGRVAAIPNFYGQDALEAGQIDEWLEYASIFSRGSEFESGCTYVDEFLLLRTFLVGSSLSVADIAIWAGLAGKCLFASIRQHFCYHFLQIEYIYVYDNLMCGASKNLNLMEWDKLWTINKKIIDPVCPRHTAVVEEKRVTLTLADGPEKPVVRIIARHKKYEGAGSKATTYTKRVWIDHADAVCVSQGEEITLMDWGNAIIKEIVKDQDGNITELVGALHLEGSVKTTKLKLTWLPVIDELVNLSLLEFDYLITKKKLEEGEDFLDVLNPCTKKETAALGDSNMRNLKRGEIIQLERKGYFRCDAPFIRSSKPIVLFAIPDGRQQTSLR
ncbi:glutamate--tRNA ligase, cytoplasmic-like [Macadamia integrifolia]|uniref:glutamate--tRNA ligase, cytoplasmic-like n=1 Tax=Macadamia integrifolia TaxID=60698 RepID=UPI001C4E8AE1|nr:glutamate--tRNA ligase, cytoplasmic-like [Macadamia integrifolia]